MGHIPKSLCACSSLPETVIFTMPPDSSVIHGVSMNETIKMPGSFSSSHLNHQTILRPAG
ncbi:hypothetical protein I7I50_11254 [Histoplasma capsulatum G186AR]|uniref:Uncharacterized protein n=1 Tax=Ajellomyces capsulatus TaxID=5037 RepID=A0A8H7ZAI9_AJECA|nr:hypothetical protein I7I52_02492 [Histoplasma capsulatum]QSS69828.1 hypothetical protein I7I50_11254 [Histoplasma capsulatum G186AR]